MDITVIMKDGSRREFKHKPRAGGSYDLKLTYEGAFAVITDEYYEQVAIPAADISEVRTSGKSRW